MKRTCWKAAEEKWGLTKVSSDKCQLSIQSKESKVFPQAGEGDTFTSRTQRQLQLVRRVERTQPVPVTLSGFSAGARQVLLGTSEICHSVFLFCAAAEAQTGGTA